MAVRLRVYEPNETLDSLQEPSVRVRLGDLLPLLAVAKKHNYLWLQDFIDEEVAVTPDLYDVLRAFSNQRRPA